LNESKDERSIPSLFQPSLLPKLKAIPHELSQEA
jgi:hypothetical protein